MNLGTHDRDREGLWIVAASESELHGSASGAAHECRQFVELDTCEGLAIDAHQDVAALQTCLFSRRTLENLNDTRLGPTHAHANTDPDVAVIAPRPGLVIPILLGVEEVGVAFINEMDHAMDEGIRRCEGVEGRAWAGQVDRQRRADSLPVGGVVAREAREGARRRRLVIGRLIRELVPTRLQERGRVQRVLEVIE
jgi:hypothetical protein